MIDLLLLTTKRIVSLSLFERPQEPLSSLQVIVWWEKRRIFFNLFVGIAGFVTVVLCTVSGIVGEKYLGVPIGIPDPPLFGVIMIVVYAIVANICYTGGWITELIVLRVWESQGHTFGKISFSVGCIYSFLLTLIPGVLVVATVSIQLMTK